MRRLAAASQRYVEDCRVCCKPNVLDICRESAAEEFVIQAQLES
ncbi:MAG: CPXCG motif-containing cysteine-rich protein [Acidobacteriaceae bacterium]